MVQLHTRAWRKITRGGHLTLGGGGGSGTGSFLIRKLPTASMHALNMEQIAKK